MSSRNHDEIIALISGQDFSPLLRISWLKSAGIQSMKAGLKLGRSLTRSNQCSTHGSLPLHYKPSIARAWSRLTYGAIAISAMEKVVPTSQSESASASSIL